MNTLQRCRLWHGPSSALRVERIAAVILISLLFANLPLLADDQTPPSPPGSEEGELADLMSIVEQETAVATKTRLNSDYVPGIVTVLEGDELEALGIATAAEALALVPGMQSQRDNSSSPILIVRGLDFPFNAGNIQILLNSVPLTRADSGVNPAILLIPIEQVERIEVIRGPGSVVHGDFAFMGLVNIVTRKEGSRLFGRFTSPQGSQNVGARTAWKIGSGNFAASASRFSSNDSYASAPNRDDDRWFGVLSAERGDFGLTFQVVRRMFNQRAALPLDEKSWSLDGRYGREIATKLHAEARASLQWSDLNNPPFQFKGDRMKLGTDFVWDGLRRQSWLLAADRSSATIDRAAQIPPPAPGQPPGPFRTLVAGAERNINGLLLQDTIDLSGSMKLTLGARYDGYSDLDSRITPRAALVWHAEDRHIVKAQYAEGFRPPTFFELYTAPAPGTRPVYPFEVNATSELHYVYRGPVTVARATVYRTVLRDLIRPGGVVIANDARADGVELEWSRQLGPSWKIDANLSYVDTSDPRAGATPRANQISAPVLGNLSFFYRPLAGLVLASRWNHIGDPRAGEGYDLVDVTISRENLFGSGVSVRAGVRNAIDSDVTTLQQRPTGDIATATFPGRSVWAQVSWRQ